MKSESPTGTRMGGMKTKNQDRMKADKIVVVRAERKKVEGKDLFFLFTTSQVEEVLLDITPLPVPFAPSFLLGVCSWRGHVVPVVDIEERFGFFGTNETAKARFLVVRTGVVESSAENKMLRCVLRVSDQIHTLDVSASSSTVHVDGIGVEPSIVRGVYQWENNFFIVPDLASILLNQR
jgi:chemotaxis signal transduction protein